MNEEELFAIGVVVNPHGRWGKLKIHPLTDFPERFHQLEEIYLVKDEQKRYFQIREVSLHKGYILLMLYGIQNRDEALRLKDSYLMIPKEELVSLPANQYFFHEIIGLLVITDRGERLGRVEDIIRTGSNDVYVVQGEKEVLIPAIKDVVQEVDVEKGILRVHLLEGLVE